MKILVTFALENEFAPWRAMRDFRSRAWGKTTVSSADIGGAEVGVIVTGIGPRIAGLQARNALKIGGDAIQFCISSGLAGAVKPQYAVGQVLAARTARSETAEGDPANTMECSAALLSFAESCGATVVNCFYTSERAIGTQQEKEHIGRFADAVEMESFGVLNEAAGLGIPATAIRAISDVANENLPLDMNEVFTDTGRVSIPRVVQQVARHPGAVPGLMKLGRQSREAAEALARFLDRYVAIVAEQTLVFDAKGAA